MPNLRSESIGPAEQGAMKWVKVKGRDDVGRVLPAGMSVGVGINSIRATVVQFDTGEILFYAPRSEMLTPCDEDGNAEEPFEGPPVTA